MQDSIDSGRVSVDFEGTGGSTDDSVKARTAKGPMAGPGPESAEIEPGSILHSSNAGMQDMMVAEVEGVDAGGGMISPASTIRVNGTQPVTYVLAAYCINFEKENPSASTSFTLARPDPVLACMARRRRSISIQALQAAFWMYTDNVTYERMSHKFVISPKTGLKVSRSIMLPKEQPKTIRPLSRAVGYFRSKRPVAAV